MPPQLCLELGELLLKGFSELVHLHIGMLSTGPGAQDLHVGQHELAASDGECLSTLQ